MANKKPGGVDGGGDSGINSGKDNSNEICCEDYLSEEDITVGKIAEEVEAVEENVSSSDEVDEELEAEYYKLNDVLDLPEDTYSLTKIRPILPACVKYGMRSGTTHFKMSKFSPLSRGLQGPACAIAGFVTNAVLKSRCWNELIIDQIVDDGDGYYCESYEEVETDDRRMLTVRDLKREMTIQNTHYVYFDIDDAAYAGTFRSQDPKELHIVKALDLFFKRYDAGLLISPNLNISIWKDTKFYNIFDGQPRGDDCSPVTKEDRGSAKLILVRDLTGVVFIILEKSDVSNEPFVLFGISVINANKIPSHPDDPEEPFKSVGDPKRRPSGYKIQEQFRALVQGSYHIMDSQVPTELRGRGHLVIAVAALIYSRLINSNKWSSVIIDLIFNQAHIYMIDLIRALKKTLDGSFELKIDDLMGDVILGVYSAKISVTVNVIPGQKKKGKSTIDSGIREFFQQNQSGILEIKKIFFPIWKEENKFYFLDPFGCDDEGFRLDPNDPEDAARYKASKPCATMNSSINQMIETILQNTGTKEKDPFFIHGLRVLYVKTGTVPGGPIDNVIYREKRTNRRPLPQDIDKSTKKDGDECKLEIDMVPKPRPDAERTKNQETQFPELMRNVYDYMMKEDEPTSFIVASPSVVTLEDAGEVVDIKPKVEQIFGYRIVNPHRLLLQGEINCLEERFEKRVRGRQGLIIALTAIAYGKVKSPGTWRNVDVNQIVDVGTQAYADTITWIQQGRPDKPEIKEQAEDEEDNEGEDEDEEGEEDDGNTEDNDEKGVNANKEFKGKLRPAPSHLDVTMLPDKIKIGENEVQFKKKMNFSEGDANPLANIGEALEHYLERYDELVVENKKLMFGVWKRDGKYHLFNPYGSDEEGQRIRRRPAAVIVTDTINELTDVFYGILEFNDSKFNLHFIGIESIQPDDKYTALDPIEIPEGNLPVKYKTLFLPVTDEDLFVPEPEPEPEKIETTETDKNESDENEEEAEDGADEEEDEKENKDEDKEVEVEKVKLAEEPVPEPEKPIIDPLLEVGEQEQPDAPDELNLSLLSGTVMVDEEEEKIKEEMNQALTYEKLKYRHPPPYVLPPKKVLCLLLEAKKASKSAHSLLSRFSIDSMLSIKKESGLPTGVPTQQPTITAVNVADGDRISKIIKLPPKKYLISRLPPTGFTPIRAINDKYLQDEELDKAKVEECRAKSRPQKIPPIPEMEEVPEIPTTVRIKPVLVPLGPPIKTPTPKKRPKPCAEKTKKRCNINAVDKGDPVLGRIMCKTEGVLLDMMFLDPKANMKSKQVVEDKKGDEKADKKADGKADEKVDEKADEKVDEKAEEKVDEKTEEKADEKVDEKADEKVDEKAEEKTDEKADKKEDEKADKMDPYKEKENKDVSRIRMKDKKEKPRSPPIPECCGFKITDEKVGVINANMCLEDRDVIEECHFKQCYFTSILCVLAKIRMDVNVFRGSILDQFILVGDKIFQRTGKLRYKALRWFYDVEILETKYNIVLRQIVYADPDNCSEETLSRVVSIYLEKNQSGILVFPSACYAFWFSEEKYYLFDPYACDDKGHANKDGYACLMQFADLKTMIKRIKDNTGELADKVFRIHAIAIAHMEPIKRKRKQHKKRVARLQKEPLEQPTPVRPEPVLSLVELSEWVPKKKNKVGFDLTAPGFSAVPNFNASTLEVIVLENDITNPIRTEFKKTKNKRTNQSSAVGLVRKKPFDRKFKENSFISEPFDLCIMAWACIHDPKLWGTKTIRGIYDASKDFTHDCILASEDTTVSGITDGVLPEFAIANYHFRAAFAPIRRGTLYEITGWNLAMSLKKVLSTSIYSGGIIICGKAHVGVMKKRENYYAWWIIPKTKQIKIITSEEMEDFLKLIVLEINEPDEVDFLIRAVAISYARKLAPDCEDTTGLHERIVPATSLAEIHKKKQPPYDLEAIFRKTVPETKPIFVQGTVAIRNRDILKEPRVKRCYFVALLAIMVKRDIIQSAVAGTIDKIIEVAEGLYKEFDAPKYHTEHILKNVTIMNRIFDFRDCASPLVEFQTNTVTGRSDHYSQVTKYLKRHFKKHSDGIIHFTNCCYGFWYSRSTNSYYYLDPYQCNDKGKKVVSGGSSCLCIFPSLCFMARHMNLNRFEDCTGFFIHRMHVESINVPPFKKLQEDPMWVYLDYHWSFSHAPIIVKPGKKKKQKIAEQEKPSWNYYAIEVPNLIYSVWGTLGCYDPRFGQRAGKNQAGISVAILAMQFLCHPSRWGPAILDSAVICGDCYYTESLRSAVRKGCRHPNRLNLQSTFKVFPHIWTIEFRANMCGTMYGGQDRLTLAATLKLALEEAPNAIIECNKAIFSVLAAEDSYYVADPRWTGPPLFTRNHGALYVLRCRNMNSLIYALTKMLNTNERLEFHIIPVLMTFTQESCRLGGEKASGKTQKQILLDPISCSPARASGPAAQIPGAITTPDEDTYHTYRSNLKKGEEHGAELEYPPIESVAPKLDEMNMNNTLISTAWHLNVGHSMPHAHSRQPFDALYSSSSPFNATEYGRSRSRKGGQDYPRLVDFADVNDRGVNLPPLTEPVYTIVPPLCAGAPSFITDGARGEFSKTVKDMADNYYKKYKHRVTPELEAEISSKQADKKKKKEAMVNQGDETEPEAEISDKQPIIIPEVENSDGKPVVKQEIADSDEEPIVKQEVENSNKEPGVEQEVKNGNGKPVIKQEIENKDAEPVVQPEVKKTDEKPVVEVKKNDEKPVVEVKKNDEKPVVEVKKNDEKPMVKQEIAKSDKDPVVEQEVKNGNEKPVIKQEIENKDAEPVVQPEVKKTDEKPVVEVKKNDEQPVVEVKKNDEKPMVEQGIEKSDEKPVVKQEVKNTDE